MWLASVRNFVLALLLLGLTPWLQAQPTLARIKTATAVVRAAPGDLSPETDTLTRGQYVTVSETDNHDWLAIQPPSGSMSWIPWTMVEPQKADPKGAPPVPPFLAVVSAEAKAPVAIRAGKVGEARPLGVERTKLPQGTFVRVIGPRVKLIVDGDSSETIWYPIAAPVDDFRFIRKDAIEWTGSPVNSNFVIREGNTKSQPLPGTSSVAPTASIGDTGDFTMTLNSHSATRGHRGGNWDPNAHPLFRDAEKARGQGDTVTAEKLYRQVAEEVAAAGPKQDVDLANLCYDRIYLLRQGNTGKNESLSARLENKPVVEVATKPETKSIEGRLNATRYKIEGRSIFALTDKDGIVRHYAISGGVDFEKYLGKWVELVGQELFPVELKGDPLLLATQVRTAR